MRDVAILISTLLLLWIPSAPCFVNVAQRYQPYNSCSAVTVTSRTLVVGLVSKEEREGEEEEHKPKKRSWDESYELLLQFHEEHGHADVPADYKNDRKLGYWITKQRRNRHKLPPIKLAKLNALHVTWDNIQELKRQKQWETMFDCLREFQKEHGYGAHPTKKQDPKLSSWVRVQRMRYKRGKLRKHEVEKLESIEFHFWERRSPNYTKQGTTLRDEKFNQWINELSAFKEKNGHCRVTKSENKRLYSWVEHNRRLFRAGELRPDRKEKLDSIGIDYEPTAGRGIVWQSRFDRLKELAPGEEEEEGALRRTWASAVFDREIYNWEVSQHQTYLRGTMDPKREAALEEIGYWKSMGLQKPEQEGDA